MVDELLVLRIVAERLESAGIPYMLSGSLALGFYGRPRMTRDIDVVVDLRGKDVPRFVALFSGDFYVDEGAVVDAVRQRGIFNLIHDATVIKVDVVVRRDEPYRKMELERARRMAAEGFEVAVAAPEDLLLSKLAWARESLSELQLGDARNLVESVPDLDWDYVERWAADLGVVHLLGRVRS